MPGGTRSGAGKHLGAEGEQRNPKKGRGRRGRMRRGVKQRERERERKSSERFKPCGVQEEGRGKDPV